MRKIDKWIKEHLNDIDIPKCERIKITHLLEEYLNEVIDNYRPCNQREKTNYEIQKERENQKLRGVNLGNTRAFF